MTPEQFTILMKAIDSISTDIAVSAILTAQQVKIVTRKALIG